MNSREYLKLILDSASTVSTAINSFNSTSEQSDSTVTQLHHNHQQQHHDETETSENLVIKMLTTLMPSLMTDDESLSNVSMKRTNLVPSSSSIDYSGLRSDQWIAPVIALAGNSINLKSIFISNSINLKSIFTCNSMSLKSISTSNSMSLKSILLVIQ